ncbi:unnamed protein product [Onchocerca flexuosa]|uniref:Secreted protein n=1 Tax=Onchocerca flexuosa TaxID=387005 RepID=A0A183I468_9BILA|nr:unnamed protein product [Onchocerca flexuosa]
MTIRLGRSQDKKITVVLILSAGFPGMFSVIKEDYTIFQFILHIKFLVNQLSWGENIQLVKMFIIVTFYYFPIGCAVQSTLELPTFASLSSTYKYDALTNCANGADATAHSKHCRVVC